MKEQVPPSFANDRYEKLEFLGSGGMGSVYRAVDKVLNRKVALKFLKEDVSKEMQGLARMRREAQILSKLRHRGLVKIYEFEAASNPPYIVMELLEGQTLADILDSRERLSFDEGEALLHQMAAALAYLHDKNLIHRDIKPGNLFLTKEGRWVLMDFGLVRTMDATGITMDGQLLGTLAFYPPELFRGKEFTTRADIYQIGLVLHLALTGKHLHPIPKNSMEWLNEVVKPSWKPLPIAKELKEPLRSIVRDCCKVDLQKRIPDGDALVEKLATKAKPQKPKAHSNAKSLAPPSKLPLFATVAIILCCLLFASLSNKSERSDNAKIATRLVRFEIERPTAPPLPMKPLLISEAEKESHVGARVFAQLELRDLLLNANRFAASMRRSAEHWRNAYELSRRASQMKGFNRLSRSALVQSSSYLLAIYDAQRIMDARGENIVKGLSLPSIEELQQVVQTELPKLTEPFHQSGKANFDDLRGLFAAFETYANSRHWKLSHYLVSPWRQTWQDMEANTYWASAAQAIRLMAKKRYPLAELKLARAIELAPQELPVSLRILLLNEYVSLLPRMGKENLGKGFKELDVQLTKSYEQLLTTNKVSPEMSSFCLYQLQLVAGYALAAKLSEVSDAAPALIWLLEGPKPAWLHDRLIINRRMLQRRIDRASPQGVEYSLPALRNKKELFSLSQQALGVGSFRKAHWLFSSLCCEQNPSFKAIKGLIRTARATNNSLGLTMSKSQLTSRVLYLLRQKEEHTRWPEHDYLTPEQVEQRLELLRTLLLWEEVLGSRLKDTHWQNFADKLPADPIALVIQAIKKHGPAKRAMLLRANKLIEKMLPLVAPHSREALKELQQSPSMKSD